MVTRITPNKILIAEGRDVQLYDGVKGAGDASTRKPLLCKQRYLSRFQNAESSWKEITTTAR
jgi:hypothetical protein